MRGAWLDDDRHGAPIADAPAPPPAARGGPDEQTRRGSWLPDKVVARSTGTLDTMESPGWVMALIIVGVLSLATMITVALVNGDHELQVGAIVGVVLFVASVIGFRFIAKHDANPRLVSLLTAALSVKIIGTWARYQVGTAVYDRSDATSYDDFGRRWAHDYLAHGQLPPGVKSWTGTNFTRLVTAYVYRFTTPSMFAGFIVFAWFGFLGCLLFWRAFRRVYPNRERPYFFLVLFAPSMVYWPSSIGKEAIVIFGLGLATYGFARCITGATLSGVVLTGAGIWLVTTVRAHVALMLIIGMFVGAAFRKRPRGQQLIGTAITVAAFAFVGVFVAGQVNSYFKTDVGSSSAVQKSFDDAVARTHQGSSEFDPVPIHSPADFPYAAMTVMFRPFPYEAGSVQEMATSLESLAYGIALVMMARHLFRRLRRDQPLALFALVSTVVFIIIFSHFANFGILARQRTQVLPFLFVLLCIPERPPKERYVPMMEKVLAGLNRDDPHARARRPFP